MKNDWLIAKKAAEFRQENGLNSSEPILLKSILLSKNVLTVFRPLSGKFCGMAIKSNDNRFMLINANHSMGKQHFTIAHELYHLFKQDDFKFKSFCTTGVFNKFDKEEYNADLFAAHLMLPEEGLIRLIPNSEIEANFIKLSTIIRMEQYYGVSRGALIYRLRDLKLINQKLYDEYAINVKAGALAHGFDSRLYEKGNDGYIIGEYGNVAKEKYDNDLISESYYMSLMMDIGKDIFEEHIIDEEYC